MKFFPSKDDKPMRMDDGRWRQWVWLNLIILLGFALRVFYLNDRGLWYDEAFAILYAARSIAEILTGTLTQVSGVAADVHPLFYYFSLHFWMQGAGESVFAARFYSVFWGVATLPVLYRLAREILGKQSGLAALSVVALAPFHLAYSQEARMYAQLGFWSVLSFWAFVRYSRNQDKRWWLVFVFTGAGALYSHNLAFINYGVLGLWTIFEALRTRVVSTLRATILAGLAMIGLWLPWLVFVPSQFGKIEHAYWVPVPTWITLVQTFLVFTFDFDNAIAPSILLPILLFGTLILPVFLLIEMRRRRNSAPRTWLMFTSTMALVPIALLFIVSQWRPVYIIRALMPAFLWYAVWIGWMLAGMPRLLRRIMVLASSLIVIALLPVYYKYEEFPRSPFRQADAMLRAQTQIGDAIVHDNKMSFFPMYYYDPALVQSFIADPVGAGSDTLAIPTQQALGLYASTLDDAIANKPRVWFVIFQTALDQAVESGQLQGNLAYLDARMTRRGVTAIGDLRIILYATR